MTDSEFIVFLPKLWVPTNFHMGSQELRFIQDIQELLEASWMAWRITSLYSISFSAALLMLYDVVHSDDMM